MNYVVRCSRSIPRWRPINLLCVRFAHSCATPTLLSCLPCQCPDLGHMPCLPLQSLCTLGVDVLQSHSDVYNFTATLSWFRPSAEMVFRGVADAVHYHLLGATTESWGPLGSNFEYPFYSFGMRLTPNKRCYPSVIPRQT